MTLGEALLACRQKRGFTLAALAERVGCAKSYLSQIEQGKNAGTPGRDLLVKLEAELTMRPGELTERAAWLATPSLVREQVAEMQRSHRAAVELANVLRAQTGTGSSRALDELYRSGILRRLVEQVDPGVKDGNERGVSSDGAVPIDLPVEIPLINSVAAGYPREFTDLGYPARVADAYIRAPDVRDPDAFACRVVGDSMMPDYREGDIVIFSPSKTVKDGADCFVRFERDAETTFKRVYFEDVDDRGSGRLRLQPLNAKYPPRVVEREAVAGVYAAVSVMRRVG